nr:hypothetical protein [Burkholderia mallei]
MLLPSLPTSSTVSASRAGASPARLGCARRRRAHSIMPVTASSGVASEDAPSTSPSHHNPSPVCSIFTSACRRCQPSAGW